MLFFIYTQFLTRCALSSLVNNNMYIKWCIWHFPSRSILFWWYFMGDQLHDWPSILGIPSQLLWNSLTNVRLTILAGLNLCFLSYRSLRCNSILSSEMRVPEHGFHGQSANIVRFSTSCWNIITSPLLLLYIYTPAISNSVLAVSIISQLYISCPKGRGMYVRCFSNIARFPMCANRRCRITKNLSKCLASC